MYGYCHNKNPAPPELSIGLDWQHFNTPYRAGGLVDQPIRLLRRVKIALAIYNAASAWIYKYTPTSESEKYWFHMHAEDMKILQRIWNWTNG